MLNSVHFCRHLFIHCSLLCMYFHLAYTIFPFEIRRQWKPQHQFRSKGVTEFFTLQLVRFKNLCSLIGQVSCDVNVCVCVIGAVVVFSGGLMFFWGWWCFWGVGDLFWDVGGLFWGAGVLQLPVFLCDVYAIVMAVS